MTVADPAGGVAYAPDRAMIEANDAATAVPGALWQRDLVLAADAAALPNGVGVPSSVASQGLPAGEWDQIQWKISQVRGPGSFALVRNGSVVADQGGGNIGLDAGSTGELTAVFGTSGLYRARGQVEGRRAGILLASQPFALVFGAGLTADYEYATWQSSFEQTAGLPEGALANPEADFDRDGLANGIEYAFFWQGLDPAHSDAALMPLHGGGRITFLRDTYKDPLDESGWQIRPSYSAGLKTWQLRSSRVPGFPLALFEAGAEEGNAHGRILRRQLRVLPAASSGFFRFEITAP